jgi:hypothetical protein
VKNFIAFLCLIASASAFAQEDVADAGVATEPVPEAVPDEPANNLQPDLEKIGLLQGKVEALEEQFIESKNVLSGLSKIKISGYVQARYTYAENSLSGVDSAGNPLVKDGFSVRRGRAKIEYQGDIARYMLQIDATPTGVVLKDAEAAFTEPWTKKKYFSLTVGQTKWPFGYETVQSSGEREFPERTRMIRAFFNGERDRGVKLGFKGGPVRAWLGVFDGNGTANKGFIGIDNDTEKDFYGRIAVDFKWIAAGVSGSTGKTYKPTDAAATGRHYERSRIGFDAQLYLDLLPFGSTAIKAEVVAGRTYQSGGVEVFGQPALGWYALLVQNIGDHEQVAFRYDYFDPATGSPNALDSKDSTRPSSRNQVHTLGILASHYFDEALKLTVIYEIPLVATGGTTDFPPKQNLFTVQLQAKF